MKHFLINLRYHKSYKVGFGNPSVAFCPRQAAERTEYTVSTFNKCDTANFTEVSPWA